MSAGHNYTFQYGNVQYAHTCHSNKNSTVVKFVVKQKLNFIKTGMNTEMLGCENLCNGANTLHIVFF